MNSKKRTAIVLGATGLTGGLVLNGLLQNDAFEKVVLFSRKSVAMKHPKLKEYIVDLVNLQSCVSEFKADVVFCCIGTTQKKTKNKDVYHNIDYGIPVAAAKLCVINAIPKFIVMSSLGANANSATMYARIKGEMEEAVLQLGITEPYILQPSLISGHRSEKRPGEWVMKQVFRIVNPLLIGALKKYKSIKPSSIAKTMIWLALNTWETKRISSDKIKHISTL